MNKVTKKKHKIKVVICTVIFHIISIIIIKYLFFHLQLFFFLMLRNTHTPQL